MTQDEIIKLAIENTIHGLKFDEEDLLRFAKLIAQHERDACAKIVDEFCYGSTKILVEKAIRARGQA
jgi:hypothetical protein